MSNPNQVVVSQVSDVTTVEITTAGPQGPSGPHGASGGGGGGSSISHGGSGGGAYEVPGVGPVIAAGSGAPLDPFDMGGNGFAGNGYAYATISSTNYFWPVWIQL